MNRRKVELLIRARPLWGSNGMAFGPDGRLYVAQFLAGQISAVDLATGDVEVVVPPDGPLHAPGGGRLLELSPAGDAPTVLTAGLAMGNAMQLGPDGQLYYPHMLTGEVFRIPLDGGEPELVAADVPDPVAVRFDRGGALLVLSRGASGIVTRVDLAGAGDRSTIVSELNALDNAAFDADNRMFVSSYAHGGVAELAADGRTRQIVPRGLGGPFGVTIDLGGGIHVADHYRLAQPTDQPDEDVTTTQLLNFVHGVAADGDLLHATSQYGHVRTYDRRSGTVRTRASGLNRPLGIAVRTDGTLVVAESGAGRVVAIDRDDQVSVLVEGLGRPVGVAVDADERCYVSDEQLAAVYRVEHGVPGLLADRLGTPQGITVSDGTAYVVETTHRRLLAIDLATGDVHIEADSLPVASAAGLTHPETRPASSHPACPEYRGRSPESPPRRAAPWSSPQTATAAFCSCTPSRPHHELRPRQYPPADPPSAQRTSPRPVRLDAGQHRGLHRSAAHAR